MIELHSLAGLPEHLDGVDVVVFDLDDTLYPEKDYVKSGFSAVGEAFPGVADMGGKLWEEFLAGEKAIDYVLQSEGLLTEENREKALDTYRNHEPVIHLEESAKEILPELKKTKRLGMITDGRPEGQRKKIRALGIQELFEIIIITDELGGAEMRKPNPRAFEMVREYFGTPYGKMVYVGDNIAKDFQAPEMIGMQCIWIRNKDGIYYR